MSLSINTVLEVRTAGSDTNGGGFVAGASGTDWSQQNATQYSVTDGVTAGTTTITSATANFGTDVVGNLIYVQGGTGSVTAGWYQIITRTNSTTITVDRSTGLTAGTGVTLKIGGSLASPGQSTAIAANGNKVWIKSGTYTITSASTNISAGCCAPAGAIFMLGYNSIRNDGGTKPVIKADGVITTFVLINRSSTNGSVFRNLELDGNSRTSSQGIGAGSTGARSDVTECNLKNFTNSAVAGAANTEVRNCYVTGCSTVEAITAGSIINCVGYANAVVPFGTTASATYVRCLAISNTGATTDGFASADNAAYVNCVSYGNGRDGFGGANQRMRWINCIAYGNTGLGFSKSNETFASALVNCASGGNGTNYTASVTSDGTATNCITLSADPFTNAAGGDFSLNTTAGAGAACRSAGIPGAFPGISTTGYLDLGVAEHQASGGGALVNAGLAN